MVLFVKRAFAIKVSGTSRVDQGREGGAGTWEGTCPREASGKVGALWFSEGWAVCEHLRGAQQTPFTPSPTGSPESLSPLN